MDLYLLRHGDAANGPFDDSLRPLTEKGVSQASSAGRILASVNPPIGRILSSPLLRAAQTAGIVGKELGSGEPISTEALIPADNPGPLIAEINRNPCEALLLVGHEPLLSSLISVLIGGTRGVRVSMRKGGLAFLKTPFPVSPGTADLEWILPPGM